MSNVRVTLSSVVTKPAPRPTVRAEDRWYAERDGNKQRFVGPSGLPLLHLVHYVDGSGERVLRLCEDSTGLLVGPKDARLRRAGVLSFSLQGESYHKAACRAGDFSPGARVRLVRQPDNPHDPNAVAVTASDDRAQVAGYITKGHARWLAKMLDRGDELDAVSVRGTRSGQTCEQIGIVAATPEVLAHLLQRRPAHLPRPAHQR